MNPAAVMNKATRQPLAAAGAARAEATVRFASLLPSRAPRPVRTFAPATPVLRVVYQPRQLSLDLRQR